MKFLVDNQLPAALARWLSSQGFDAVHVLDRDLARDDDHALWDLAISESRIMVSKDEDFFHLAHRAGDGGRLLWLRVGNCRKQSLIDSIQKMMPAIQAAFDEGQRIVEIR